MPPALLRFRVKIEINSHVTYFYRFCNPAPVSYMPFVWSTNTWRSTVVVIGIISCIVEAVKRIAGPNEATFRVVAHST